MRHEIKTKRKFYEAVLRNEKTFELRKDDRGYQVGDTVILEEWDEEKERYTGRWQQVKISYVLRDCPEYGLKDGYCIFGWR